MAIVSFAAVAIQMSEDLSFLTPQETQAIIEALYQQQLGDSFGTVIARASTIEVDGYILNFENAVEDDGTSGGLLGPYDKRAGRFSDESDWGASDWWEIVQLPVTLRASEN